MIEIENSIKHYVVISQFVVDCEDGLSVVCVSHSLADALLIYQKELEEAQADAKANGYDAEEQSEGENGERYFSAYLDGSYSSDHISVSLIVM